MKEVWRDIRGFEGLYKVSNLGGVLSCRNKQKKIISPISIHSGYLIVSLSKCGKRKTFCISHLVWDAFIGKSREDLQVDHIDGSKTNNQVTNLQLLTRRENIAKGYWQNGRELPTGIWKNGKNYRAGIQIGKKRHHLGSFKTIEQASSAYQKALGELL